LTPALVLNVANNLQKRQSQTMGQLQVLTQLAGNNIETNKEEEKYTRRYHELEEATKRLRKEFMNVDIETVDIIDVAACHVALQQFGLRIEDIHSQDIQLLINQMTNQNNKIPYKLFCDFNIRYKRNYK